MLLQLPFRLILCSRATSTPDSSSISQNSPSFRGCIPECCSGGSASKDREMKAPQINRPPVVVGSWQRHGRRSGFRPTSLSGKSPAYCVNFIAGLICCSRRCGDFFRNESRLQIIKQPVMCGLGGGASGSAFRGESPERGVNMIQLKIRPRHHTSTYHLCL
jgi:hypothetical protein